MITSFDLTQVAERFVDLALRPRVWHEDAVLSESDMVALFETVAAAGFEPKSVVLGKLKGDYLEQDGGRSGETYPINKLCSYKVIAENGQNHYLATGWLDCAATLVAGLMREGKTREVAIERVREEIENSRPLPLVQLTKDGDLLSEYPKDLPHFGHFKYFVAHTRDGDKLASCVGVHKYCQSWMDRRGATATHDAIVCRGCHLRVLFPKTAKTYGELRGALGFDQNPP